MRKSNKVEKRQFFGFFWLIFAMFLTSQSYNFDAFAHAGGPFGCKMIVQKFMEIVWTVFEKFEIFIERSGEKKNKNKPRTAQVGTITKAQK